MLDIMDVFRSTKTETALKMWRERFSLEVGMISMVMSDYRIELHRLSETNFVFAFGNLSNKEFSAIMDAIKADDAK